MTCQPPAGRIGAARSDRRTGEFVLMGDTGGIAGCAVDGLWSAAGRQPSAVSAGTARQWVTRHRAANALVTVTHDGNVLVPTFQLDAAFGLDPDCRDVISRLRDHGMDGWAIWDWAQTPNTWLDGDTPAERLDTGDLDAVHHAITGLFQQR